MFRIQIIIFLFSILSCNKTNSPIDLKPSTKNIKESVYASIKIVPNQSYSVRPNLTGTIAKIFVNEGDSVIIGQPLFQISTSPLAQFRKTDAQLLLEEAVSNYQGENNLLSNLENEIEILNLQKDKDSINFYRLQSLWNQKIGKKSDLENAEFAYKNSKNRLTQILNQYEQNKSNLKRQVQKARELVASENAQLNEYFFYSKINGTVFKLEKEVGDLISPQEIFAEIGSDNNWIIEMEVDESDISKLNSSDTTILSLDAYPDEVFSALSYFISKRKNELTQTFLVKAVFIQPPPKLYYGLNGEANIIVNTKENALVIPSEYLLSGNKVLTPDGEIEVVTGMKNLDFVEILSGIDTSTILLKPGE